MKQANKNRISLLLIVLSGLTFSCNKYLDKRSDKSLVIPQTVKQLQGMLDHVSMTYDYPVAGKMADDDTYYPTSDYNAIFYPDDRKNYIWDPSTDRLNDWYNAYQRIAKCNVALSVLDNLNDPLSTGSEKDNVKGSALFFRAFNFYELAQIFSPQYSNTTINSEFGIPLKSSPDINDQTTRSTVQQTYDKIIADLEQSAGLLPTIATYKTRPSKAAAYALLARTYLVMGDYNNSLKYSDLSLQTYSSLIDYNSFPFSYPSFDPPFNAEVIFAAESTFDPWYSARIDTTLFNLYSDDDIRKQVFFTDLYGDGTQCFIGSYGGTESYEVFSGIATDEVYLIRAESYARTGKISQAMTDLNSLLVKRWTSGTFVPYTAIDQKDALSKILKERRKELVFRPSLRWSDIRRLNLDNTYAITLKRILGGQPLYTLAPNDPRYTFLIPKSVIDLGHIPQNPR